MLKLNRQGQENLLPPEGKSSHCSQATQGAERGDGGARSPTVPRLASCRVPTYVQPAADRTCFRHRLDVFWIKGLEILYLSKITSVA